MNDAQVADLFRRWKESGDRRARDLLVERYLPLTYSLARRYRGAHEPIGDLRQVAVVGLLKAIDKFDPERGFNFPAFAVPSILGELRRHFRDHGWSVHLPRGTQELALRVNKARGDLEQLHASVTAPMIAEHLGLSVEEVLDGLQASDAHHSLSYDAPSSDGGGEEDRPTLLDRLGSDDGAFAVAELAVDIDRASQVLSERERTVLQLRFEKDLTQSEIAKDLGISQMQVSRIIRQALATMGDQMGESAGSDEPGQPAGPGRAAARIDPSAPAAAQIDP